MKFDLRDHDDCSYFFHNISKFYYLMLTMRSCFVFRVPMTTVTQPATHGPESSTADAPTLQTHYSS